jgi:hypothetical protein
MSEVYKFSAHIPARTGLPADDSVNSFYFKTASTITTANMAALIGVIDSFYAVAPTGHGLNVGGYYSNDRDPGSGKVRYDVYHLPAARTVGPKGFPAYGPPIYHLNTTWVPNAGSTTAQPDQVAMCLSYHSDYTAGPNLKRRRGRIFLGPLNTVVYANGTGSSSPQSVGSTVRATVLQAAVDFLQTAAEALSFAPRWQVWSPTDWASHDVIQASVDDRFDTQRRRLEKASIRDTVVIT